MVKLYLFNNIRVNYFAAPHRSRDNENIANIVRPKYNAYTKTVP